MATSNNSTLEPTKQETAEEKIDWKCLIRVAALGVKGGMLSTAPAMMAVGAIKKDANAMILAGFLGLVGSASSQTIGEFVADYFGKIKTNDNMSNIGGDKKKNLPKPLEKAIAVLGFIVGAMVPLLSAAAFKGDVMIVRLNMVMVAVTLTLLVLGWIEAMTREAPLLKSCLKVLIPAWMTIAITFGMTKLVGSDES